MIIRMATKFLRRNQLKGRRRKRTTRNMETWASDASDDEQQRKRKEKSWTEQGDLAYPLEECEFRTQIEDGLDLDHPRLYGWPPNSCEKNHLKGRKKSVHG